MPLFCTPLNFAKFLFSEIHPVKKNKALATPTLSDSPALRKAYGPKWDKYASKDNINPSLGKQKAPTPRPPPWGRERASGVNIGAVWRCPGLQQGQRRPEASPARRKAFWSGRRPSLAALQAAANLGAVAPSPPLDNAA